MMTFVLQNGWSPLHCASFNGNLDIVRALIEAGANISHAHKDGKTAMNIAVVKGHKDIIQVLETDQSKIFNIMAQQLCGVRQQLHDMKKESEQQLHDLKKQTEQQLYDMRQQKELQLRDMNKQTEQQLFDMRQQKEQKKQQLHDTRQQKEQTEQQLRDMKKQTEQQLHDMRQWMEQKEQKLKEQIDASEKRLRTTEGTTLSPESLDFPEAHVTDRNVVVSSSLSEIMMGSIFRSKEMTLAGSALYAVRLGIRLHQRASELDKAQIERLPVENIKAPDPHFMTDLEAKFERLEGELKLVNSNRTALRRNLLDLTELHYILGMTQDFFIEAKQGSVLSVVMHGGLEEEKAVGMFCCHGYLSWFVTGVIARERLPVFQRVLWRACVVGNLVSKCVFILFFQGDQLRARVKKICEGDTGPEGGVEGNRWQQDRRPGWWQPMSTVQKLKEIADEIEAWLQKVRVMKRSPQSIPNRRRKCCRCNGVNARWPVAAIARVLAIIQESGPPLGLNINIAKCELFSSRDLSSFPEEMRRSNVPHFEILGAPIGDLVFCAKFVAQKQSEASKLLKELEAVGSIDPQVALLLLRQYVLVPNWDLGKLAAFDLSVTSTLQSSALLEASVTAGSAALLAENRKHNNSDKKCDELGWACIPLVVETYGCWGAEAVAALSKLAGRLSVRNNELKSKTMFSLYSRLGLTLLPTPIVTFPFLFAVMFGDAGHGLLMTLYAFTLLIFQKRLQGVKNEPLNIFGSSWRPYYYGASFFLCRDGKHDLSREHHVLRGPALVKEVCTLPTEAQLKNQPYPFGLDPVWAMADNELIFTNPYKEKANVTIKDGNMWLPLHYATWNGFLECVNATLHVPEHQGLTGLNLAIGLAQTSQLEEILAVLTEAFKERQMSVVATNPLDTCTSGEKDRLVEVLEEGDEVNPLVPPPVLSTPTPPQGFSWPTVHSVLCRTANSHFVGSEQYAGVQHTLDSHRRMQFSKLSRALKSQLTIDYFKLIWVGPSDFNLYTRSGSNVLMLAAHNTYAEIVTLLVQETKKLTPDMMMMSKIAMW
eukprot:Em0594g1a